MYFQLLMSGLTIGACYALIALGFTLIFNATRIFNFAQGEWVMCGAMVYATLMVAMKWPFLPVLFLSILGVGLIGFFFDRMVTLAIRRRANLVSLLIVTLAGGIVLKSIAQKIWGELPYMAPAVFARDPFRIWGAVLTYQHVSILGINLIVVILLWFFFSRTYIGKAARASAFNPETAELMGINVRLIVALMFALSAGMSALAGLLISPLSSASTGMGINLAIKGFVAAILGGAGSIVGSIVGGVFLGVLEALAGRYISSGYNAAIPFVIMIIVLFVRPSGILGKKEIEKV